MFKFKSTLLALALMAVPLTAIGTSLYLISPASAQSVSCVSPVQNAQDAVLLGAKLENSLSGEKLYVFWDYIAKKFDQDRAVLATVQLVEFYKLADGNILVIMYVDGCTVNGFTMPYDAYVQQQEEAFGQEI